MTPDLPPHGVNPQLLWPDSAPGTAQVLSAPVVGSALGLTRLRRAAPPVRDRVRALSLSQAVLGQTAADSPTSDCISAFGRHGSGSPGPNAQQAQPTSGGPGCARLYFRPARATLVGLGSLRLCPALCGATRPSP